MADHPVVLILEVVRQLQERSVLLFREHSSHVEVEVEVVEG